MRVTQIYGRIFRPNYSKSGPDNPPPPLPWNRLRTRRREGVRHPDSWPDYSRSGPKYLAAGLSGPNLPRIIRPLAAAMVTFREGVFIPLPLIFSSYSSSSRTRHYLEPTSLLDLHLQPPKVSDLWRIEGGGPDLHLHRRNFCFPSFCLRDLFLVVPWKH
jgi:hypothetical protein